MPKEKKDRSVSLDRSRASPMYSSPTPTDHEIREWEEAMCPICIEPPHNAVLVVCSSYDKGCRPYICSTSVHLSNCISQFILSSKNTTPHTEEEGTFEGKEVASLGLKCPFCRGKVLEVNIVEAARSFMDSKIRSCSAEKCKFSGTYAELKEHAMVTHRNEIPSKADPERQLRWMIMDVESALNDLRSSLGPDHGVVYPEPVTLDPPSRRGVLPARNSLSRRDGSDEQMRRHRNIRMSLGSLLGTVWSQRMMNRRLRNDEVQDANEGEEEVGHRETP